MEEVCCCFGLFCMRFDEQADGGDFACFDVGFGFLAVAALGWGWEDGQQVGCDMAVG